MNDQADYKQRFGNILNKKTNYLIVNAVLVIIFIFAGSGSKQDQMLAAQKDHDHEKALIIANKILKQDPNNSTAKAVIKQSGELFYYLQEAKLTFDQFETTSDSPTNNPENLLEGLHKARLYTAKAKAIDPKAERLLAFESTLDEAENKLGYILAHKAMSAGQSVISIASSNYQTTNEILNAAETSTYLAQFMTFQSSGASIGKPVKELMENIEPHLQQMEKTSQYVASSGSKDKSLNEVLSTYITSVKSAVDTLLAPQGTFKDFSAIADKSMADYTKSLGKLKKKISKQGSIKENITDLIASLTGHHVFHDHSIYVIMSSYKTLYEK